MKKEILAIIDSASAASSNLKLIDYLAADGGHNGNPLALISMVVALRLAQHD